MEQRPIIVIAPEDNTATVATVATVRTAIGLILDMTEVHAATAALTRAADNTYVVYEIGFHVKK